jgi:2-polyprenyl-3-methyl-5-hydroxy-6-metoxy-1,4-benzoquinol methylase
MRNHAEIQQLTDRVAQLEAERAEAEESRRRLHRVEGWLGDLTERVEAIGGLADFHQRRLTEISAELEGVSEQVRGLQRRVPSAGALVGPGASGLEEFDAGLGGTVIGFRAGGADAGDRVYLDFEDAFRGSEETIRERQRVYLPLLQNHGPVLDVGCGRGELLELLAAGGIPAEGIDSDAGMVSRCHERGLSNVRRADALDFLRSAGAGAFGSVVALQVIEHLPYEALLDFLRASRAALAPGGRLIVETVNPHAPQALKHFWIDPTHQHPLFPEITLLLCRLSGFAEGFIWYPWGSGDPEQDRAGQPDYAIVCTAP